MCGRVVLSPDFEFNNNNTCGMLNIKPFTGYWGVDATVVSNESWGYEYCWTQRMTIFDQSPRFAFNIFFVSILGLFFLLLIVIGIYLAYKRRNHLKQRRVITDTNNRLNSTPGYTTNSFIVSRAPPTDIVLGIYGDNTTKSSGSGYSSESGWRGFAYSSCRWRHYINCLLGNYRRCSRRLAPTIKHFKNDKIGFPRSSLLWN